MANTIKMDTTRGFDVMRGKTAVHHYDTYEEARAYTAAHKGTYIRYWAVKEG